MNFIYLLSVVMGTKVMAACFVFHRPCCLPTHMNTASLVSDIQQKMLTEFPVSYK